MIGSLFCPNRNVAVSASTTSTNSAIGGGRTVRIQNTGVVPVHIKFGKSDVTATVSDMPIMDGTAPEMMSLPQGTTHVAAITSSGTATIIFTTGEGE